MRRCGEILAFAFAFAVAISPAPVAAEQPPLNIVLITLDTLRADRLGCYGDPLAMTPTLDLMAKRGRLLMDCSTAVPITLPSHATLLTGLFPHRHGLRVNGRQRLHPDVPVLGELLQAKGYHNGAFIGSFALDSQFGLARGFDVYNDEMDRSSDSEQRPIIQRMAERRADAVISAAIEWLASGREPFMLWTHLFDPHQPYDPLPPWTAACAGDAYAGEIGFMDKEIGRLLRYLVRDGALARSVLCAVADHGEGLDEHGEATHSTELFQTTIHVPLLFSGPSFSRGAISAEPVTTADVPVTLALLSQSGARLSPEVDGRDIAAGGPSAAPYLETLAPEIEYGWSRLNGIRRGSLKLIIRGHQQLFDLETDPGESNNLAAQRPQDVVLMQEQLHAEIARGETVPSRLESLDQESEQKLRALGYLGAEHVSAGEALGAGVLGQQAALQRLFALEALIDAGRYATALAELDVLLSDHPKLAQARVDRGRCLLALGRPAEAIAELERVLAVSPDNSTARFSLARAYYRTGQLDNAELHYLEIVRTLPAHAKAWFNLGLIALNQQRWPEAEARFQSARNSDPSLPGVRVELARSAAAQGRLSTAISLLQEEITRSPDQEPGYLELSEVLAGQEQLRQAIEVLSQLLAQKPESFDGRVMRGRFLLQLGQAGPAKADFQAANEIQPDNEPAHFYLGMILKLNNELAEARRQFEDALQAAPDSIPVKIALAETVGKLGDSAAEIRMLEESLAAAPNHPLVLRRLGMALLQNEASSARAQELLRRAQETGATAENK